MKITIESTEQIVKVNGAPARIWEGKTESGIPIFAMITKIGVHENDDALEFQMELKECKEPVITKGWHGTRMDFID